MSPEAIFHDSRLLTRNKASRYSTRFGMLRKIVLLHLLGHWVLHNYDLALPIGYTYPNAEAGLRRVNREKRLGVFPK